MKAFSRLAIVALLFALCATSHSQPAQACTGITLKAVDGSIVRGRTLEFGIDLRSNLLIVPAGTDLMGTIPGGQPGKAWKAKYGAVGINAYNYKIFLDGVNERGLSVGLFYFPGYAKYQTTTPADASQTIAPHELGALLLTTCSTVDEAVTAARAVKVGNVVLKEFGFVPPAHYIINDASGKCVVLEYVDGKLNVHKNPLGVLTNSPTFDWHVTNLKNYVNLSAVSLPAVTIGNLKFEPFGQGSGMLGIPGDFTPPSRFVRAVAFSQSAFATSNSGDAVKQVFHILNQFDIPRGAARDRAHPQAADYTMWTSAADLKDRKYYFRTFDNSRIRVIDLSESLRNAKEVRTISMAGDEQFEKISVKPSAGPVAKAVKPTATGVQSVLRARGTTSVQE